MPKSIEKITLADAERAEQAAAAKAAARHEPQNYPQHFEHAPPPYRYPYPYYYGPPVPTAQQMPPTQPPPEKKTRNILSQHEKKKLLFYYFSNGSASSLRKYCETQNISAAVRNQMQRAIRKHPVLKDMQGKIGEAKVRNDAMSYINLNFPGPRVLPKSTVPKQKDFFTVSNIHEIASNLDFEEVPRMSRNGKKEIPLHDRQDMNERTRSLAMAMIQMVIANTPKITRATEDQLFVDAGTITMYDQGYKFVRGVTTFRKAWMPRLIKYLQEGVADAQAPLEEGHKHRCLND